MTRPEVRAFGRGAAPAVVGLHGVTAAHLARSGVRSNVGDAMAAWPYGVGSALAAVLAFRTKLHPALILAGGAVAGALIPSHW